LNAVSQTSQTQVTAPESPAAGPSALLRLQDEERRDLARELHDSTAQKLAALIIGLGLLEDQLESGDVLEAKRLLTDCVKSAEDCARDIRNLSGKLYPPLLDELGLEPALENYVHGLAGRGDLRVTLKIDGSLDTLPRDLALALYRVTEECLTNTLRHSGSPTASIHIARTDNNLTLKVRDEGRGIADQTLALLLQRQPGPGLGIPGMRELLEQFGGALELDASPLGTTVHARIPLSPRCHEEDSHPVGR
jgi:two-component system, NarL family, sensor kinase